MQIKAGIARLFPVIAAAAVGVGLLSSQAGVPALDAAPNTINSFELVGSFDVAALAGGSGAEIVAATKDGKTLIYTDALLGSIGFVDISNPSAPSFITSITAPGGGEPTSVATTPEGKYALVVVKGPPNLLWVVDLSDRSTATELPLNGEPDSVAVSPDGQYAVIAVENERPDEDVPFEEQNPVIPGFVVIVELKGKPSKWTLTDLPMTGLAERFPDDPEPEFVDINKRNQAAITLQENNHIVIVDLRRARIIDHFSAGQSTHAADLTNEPGNNPPFDINFTETLTDAFRQPDGIGWTEQGLLITANEGDYDLDLGPGEFTGGRDWTVFSPSGSAFFQSFASMEEAIAEAGLYDDGRSDDSGVEPEGIELGKYGSKDFLFVGGERCSCVVVYELLYGGSMPRFVQVLQTTGIRPEGLLAIPHRGLFVSANEGDEGDPPGTISLYQGVR